MRKAYGLPAGDDDGWALPFLGILMNYEDGIPIDELRSNIYFRGIEIRNAASQLLKECREFKIGFWSIRKTGIHELAKKYDGLYAKYVSHDASVLSYAGMCSNPWSRSEEDEIETKNIETLLKLNISADGLTSQRETIRMLLTDISNQLNNLYSDVNNRIVNWIAFLSLFIALVSLLVSLVALTK